jgi:hypothetical protein
MNRHLRLALVLTLFSLPSAPASAEVQTYWDNDTDAFVPGPGTDRNYTQGTRVNLFGAPDALPAPARWLADRLPGFAARGAERQFGLSLGQEIYTPRAITARRPIYDDRPYAASSSRSAPRVPLRTPTTYSAGGTAGSASGHRRAGSTSCATNRASSSPIRNASGRGVTGGTPTLCRTRGRRSATCTPRQTPGGRCAWDCRCPTTSGRGATPPRRPPDAASTCTSSPAARAKTYRSKRRRAQPLPRRQHNRPGPARHAAATGGRGPAWRGGPVAQPRLPLHLLLHHQRVPRAPLEPGVRLLRHHDLISPPGILAGTHPRQERRDVSPL